MAHGSRSFWLYRLCVKRNTSVVCLGHFQPKHVLLSVFYNFLAFECGLRTTLFDWLVHFLYII